MLLLVLACWYSATPVAGDAIISPLPSKSGLFYQEEGEIRITESSWKLIVYRDLEPLSISRDSIQRLSNTYYQIISTRPSSFSLHTSTSFIKLSLNKINDRLSELNSYTTKSRAKRELFDGLGSVLKWLIGTPDAKDAQFYEQCIQKLENREMEQADILKQQIQIVSSTITNFNDTVYKISYDEFVLNENLERVRKYLNSTNNVLFDLKTSEEISVISIQILESVMSLESELDDILTAILFIKSGAVHPSIISVERLYAELLSTTHLRTESLILPVTFENVHKILDSASISSYVYKNKLTFIMDFPLVKNDKFTLYHIYSIPIPHPNTILYSTLLPEQPYLATSPTRQQYIATDSMSTCKTTTSRRWICNLPVYNVQTRPTCEMSILMHTTKDLPETCETTTFSAHINVFQPLEVNRWLYMLQNNTASTLQCGGTIKHLTLLGNGILTLPEGCKFYSAFITLTATNEGSKNISHPIVTVDIEDNCPETPEDLPRSPEIIPIRISNIPVDGLSSIKEELKLQSKKIKTFREASYLEKHSSKLNIFTYLLGIGILSFLLYKLCRLCPRSLLRRNSHSSGCIQIYNNCFDRRKQRTHITIPLSKVNTNSNVSEDDSEDDEITAAVTTPQKLGNAAQSLF